MKITTTILAFITTLVLSPTISANRFNSDIDTRAHTLLDSMTLDEKLSLVRGVDLMYTRDIPRLGISRMRMADGPQGVRGYGLSTAYPSAVMLTATWNENLATRYGDALGSDCRARGVNFLLGPGVNIYRSPLNGRNFEYMGEDPYLASRTAVNYIKGVQNHGVSATVKHLFGNNSEYDRNYTSSDIDERTMYEIYLPVFKAAVQEAEVGAVMSSYNPVNGIWTAESEWLLTDILRNKWGFKGVIMSDWDAVHHTIPAFTAGLDLEMPGSDLWKPETLAYYLKTGHIDTDMLDKKVLNILRTYLAFDAARNCIADSTIPLNDPHSVQVALDVAREGIVLLKNNKNTLPVNPARIKNIVVVGNAAISVPCGGGSGGVDPFYRVTPLDAIKKIAAENGINVKYVNPLDVMPQIIFTDDTKSTYGLTAQFFNNENLEGTPAASRIDSKIAYLWLEGPGVKGIGKEHYSVRWNGKIIPDQTGEYQFTAGAYGKYRLFIDGKEVVNNWDKKKSHTTTFTTTFKADHIYDITFEVSQNVSTGGAQLVWQPVKIKNDPLTDQLDNADLIIACVGHNAATESESFDRPITLPEEDNTMMKRLSATSTPVVAVVNSGGNILLPDYNKINSLLWAWFPGQEGGTAVAEVLFGKVNPSGKLPMTFEKRWEDNPVYNSYHDNDGDKHVPYSEGIFVGYRGYDKLQRDVMYPFGFGLSYTTFDITKASATTPDENGNVTICFTLKNTGHRDGAQVVQAYVGKDLSEPSLISRPIRELRGFRKIFLKAGESKDVTITLPATAFTYYDTIIHDFTTEPGTYNIDLGFSSRDIRSSLPIYIADGSPK